MPAKERGLPTIRDFENIRDLCVKAEQHGTWEAIVERIHAIAELALRRETGQRRAR